MTVISRDSIDTSCLRDVNLDFPLVSTRAKFYSCGGWFSRLGRFAREKDFIGRLGKEERNPKELKGFYSFLMTNEHWFYT